MPPRKPLPMKTDSEYGIISVLNTRHQIPYHSRKFTWERTRHIETVVNAIISDWRNNAIHWLGILIIYNNDIRLPAISDGQHRVTICFLMVLALAELLKNDQALDWISKYGSDSIICDTVTDADQAIMTEYGWTRFPNIHSVFESDFEALGNILNRLAPSTDSMLHDAYDTVLDILSKTLRDSNEYKNLLQFIHNDIKMTRVVITESAFTLKLFSALNNIKVLVDASYLVRNIFIQAIGDARAHEVHSAFEAMEKTETNYEHFVFMMFNIFRRQLTTKSEFDSYLATNPTLKAGDFPEFLAVAAKGQEYMKLMMADRFGKILFKKAFLSGNDVVEYCLLPLAFVGGFASIRSLLRKLVAYGIRLPVNRKVTFNSMSFQKPLRALVAKIFAGITPVPKACEEITGLLRTHTEDSIEKRVATDKFDKKNFTKARSYLLYLQEVTDHHESALDHDRVHVDHIFARTKKSTTEPLTDPENIHRLGNFTLLCGSNTETLKGNAALSNKPFKDKVVSYSLSNIAMTREIAAKSAFADAEIEERSWALAKQLDKLTTADLS